MSNGKVKICLDPARCKQALIWLVRRGPTLNDIFPTLNNLKYLFHRYAFWVPQPQIGQEIVIPHNIFISVWQVQIQKTAILSTPTGDMFQRKIDKIFKNVPNVFCIADDILVVGYDRDGKDHDKTL